MIFLKTVIHLDTVSVTLSPSKFPKIQKTFPFNIIFKSDDLSLLKLPQTYKKHRLNGIFKTICPFLKLPKITRNL